MRRLLAACLVFFSAVTSLRGEDAKMVQLVGRTMGTTYSVKLFDPPPLDDIQLRVDATLRRVNDQMSTYLKSSEISRFNASESTDWFEVSAETAEVVEFAQQLSRKTGGAFDVTVGPLVNAWSFGPDPRNRTVPDQATLDGLLESVGYEKLSVRTDPPGLRKSHPLLQVDLSAIAKGHGVDRVVELLNEAGARNVFVEIGGEVRTSGSKAGQWWKVGIQIPDVERDAVMIAHALSTGDGNDQSMATSGDYRNFFELDGVRYSHTIDPRTAKPVDHRLASVSVVCKTCMAADAWATAINVLGTEEGLAIASREQLDALVVSRSGQTYVLQGTGALAMYDSEVNDGEPQTGGLQGAPLPAAAGGNSLVVVAITLVAFACILSAMAVGVIFGRRAISGSCGGLSGNQNDDGSVSCSLCSNPSDACKELRERME